MKIYLFSPDTRAFIGEGVADPSPVGKEEWLIPASATTIAPPAVAEGEVAVYDGQGWSIVGDSRGKWYTEDGQEVEITAPGEPAPIGASREPRPSETHSLVDGAWVLDLAKRKAAKNAEINGARMRANRSSFSFGGHEIACDELSRSDIDGVAAYVALHGALPPGFPGAWKALDNTYVPVADVAAFKAMIAAMSAAGIAHFGRAQDLKAQLAAAVTVAEIEAIIW